ncbi:hypothetical protein ACHWQZ_G012451 [Mnemiopsis leidyi]
MIECRFCRKYFNTESERKNHDRKCQSDRHKTERFESYCQRLGYSNWRQLSQDAIRRLGPSAQLNDLLECVIQMEKKRGGPSSKR